MEEVSDAEILVHIAASSTAADDARYRSWMAAYQACEPGTILRYCSPNDDIGGSQGGSQPQHSAIDEGDTLIMPSDDRIDFSRSPQASFRSVVDNADSPRMRRHIMLNNAPPQQMPSTATQASWQTPPSIVQDSHPIDYMDSMSLTSPTRVLENYLQDFESPSCASKQESWGGRLAVSPSTTDRYRYGYRGASWRDPGISMPKMIPCTPRIETRRGPLSEGGKASKCRNIGHSKQQLVNPIVGDPNESMIEETIFMSSSQPPTQPPLLTRSDSEPLHRLCHLEPAVGSHAIPRASSDLGSRPLPRNKAPVMVEFLSSHGFTYKSLEIRPPDPPTSEPIIKPHDLITQGLQDLGRDVGLPSCFHPNEQMRELQPYERGHWLLDCSSWEPRLKLDAWAFLANYIGTGKAGWGVWCKRDLNFGELRTYCWGSVVAHIYYVLWLSSQGRIAFTGSSWVDAAGKRIIIMNSKDQG
ncbi:hypothetical protein SAMD00023353_0303210 [Rosellinia necatrix]|uniref:Uncharacterized protein n=1 Tax=Rosellinia necatrix TaxID=77044 RepID=A0A1S8A580_ROSNE|nr:hypothetical protein SAMD00023353_0303210 [Rosellinia necatrix]